MKANDQVDGSNCSLLFISSARSVEQYSVDEVAPHIKKIIIFIDDFNNLATIT